MRKGYVINRTNGGHVRQHRLVVEKCMGRKLTSKEVVHHINGDKSDNRIINLILFENQIDHMKFHSVFDCTIIGLDDCNKYKNKEGLMDILYDNYGILFYGEIHHEDIKKNALNMAERMKRELGIAT